MVQPPLPTPGQRVSGIDLNKARLRSVLSAVIALSAKPGGFGVGDLAQAVHPIASGEDYSARQAAYDLRKLRGKGWIERRGKARRYQANTSGLKIMVCLTTLRDKVIQPLLAGATSCRPGRKTKNTNPIDTCYQNLRTQMETLFGELGIAA